MLSQINHIIIWNFYNKEDLETIVLDRVLFTSMVYPANYGFILQTEGKDEDELIKLIKKRIDVKSTLSNTIVSRSSLYSYLQLLPIGISTIA